MVRQPVERSLDRNVCHHVVDLELTDQDMAAIAGLDQGEAAATDSDVTGH